jgi:hypothetical protein
MSLTTNILNATARSIDRLFQDSNLTKSIVWQLNTGQTLDAENQVSQPLFIDYQVPGIYTEKEKYIIPAGETIGIQATEAAFLCRLSDLPETYSKADRIVAEGKLYRIDKIEDIASVAVRAVVKGI